MFGEKGWRRLAVEGPIPLVPAPDADLETVLAFADRCPFTGGWIDAIISVNPASLCDGDKVRLAAAWERICRGGEAGRAESLGWIAPRRCDPEPGDQACPGDDSCAHDWSRDEVAAALHLGPVTGQQALAVARELTHRLPRTLAAVADGLLPAYSARTLASRTLRLDDDRLVSALEAGCLREGELLTPNAFTRRMHRLLSRLRTPAEAALEYAEAVRSKTGISPGTPREDGLASATITAAPEQIAQLFQWGRQFTRHNRQPDDDRTVGQRRVDGLIAALNDCPHEQTATAGQRTAPADTVDATKTAAVNASTDPVGASPAPESHLNGTAAADPAAPHADPRAARPRISLRLIMKDSTLLGRDDDDAWLDGHGLLAAELARALALAPTTVQRLLIHPKTGHLVDLSPRLRTPKADLDAFVRARDHTCDGLGCHRNAETSELDHETPYALGGLTVSSNIRARCAHNHRQRHGGRWRARRIDDRTTEWISPTGQIYQGGPLSADDDPLDWPDQPSVAAPPRSGDPPPDPLDDPPPF